MNQLIIMRFSSYRKSRKKKILILPFYLPTFKMLTCFPNMLKENPMRFSFSCFFFFEYHYELKGDFPGGSDSKACVYNVGDPASIPGLGRSPGEGNGNPLQYYCLENPMDRGAWQATVHGIAKSRTERLHFTYELKDFKCVDFKPYSYSNYLIFRQIESLQTDF